MAAHLAAGVAFSSLGPQLQADEIVDLRLPDAVARDGGLDTAVLFIDTFGNCTLGRTGKRSREPHRRASTCPDSRSSSRAGEASCRGQPPSARWPAAAPLAVRGRRLRGSRDRCEPGLRRGAVRPRDRPADSAGAHLTPMAGAPLLEVEALTFRYRRASEPAIRDLSLTIDPGEVLLVAGPSGCGKSTLIRAINGLIPHAYPGDLQGVVRVDGHPTTELRMRDIALTVGTMLQDPGPARSSARRSRRSSPSGPRTSAMRPAEIRQRIGEVDRRRRESRRCAGARPPALSGGERQLLAMAGILMLRPRLYVVDEPLANLDPATARRLLATLRDARRRGPRGRHRRAPRRGGAGPPPGPRPLPR